MRCKIQCEITCKILRKTHHKIVHKIFSKICREICCKIRQAFAQGVLPSKEGCRDISPGDLSRVGVGRHPPYKVAVACSEMSAFTNVFTTVKVICSFLSFSIGIYCENDDGERTTVQTDFSVNFYYPHTLAFKF